MIQENLHIVSKVVWDTSFGEKSEASNLQSEISSWSKYKMEQEIVRVFDKMCPPNEIWRIDSLVLNLGEIEYNELQRNLSRKFSKELLHQLNDLFFMTNTKGGIVKVKDKKIAQLSILKSYLVNGYMPWWNNSVRNNIHQLLENLLKENKTELISLIRDIGRSQVVRQRMVWQFRDASLIKIVEELEPNNHKQIIEFADDLITIQEEEKVVKMNLSEFRTEAWLWVLSHLLLERGTLFNKVAFMKSLLNQMASRFNFKYNELVELIEMAIEKLLQKSKVKSDFITTLNLLSIESKNEKKKISTTKKTALNYWNLLNNYLSNTSTQANLVSSSEFNELVISLSKRDQLQFNEWITHVKTEPRKWNRLVQSLNKSGYAAILAAISPIKSSALLNQVTALSDVLKVSTLKFNSNQIWEASLYYLINNLNNSTDATDPKGHMQYLIEKLATIKNIATILFLNKLTDAHLWSTEKSRIGIELFEELSSRKQSAPSNIDSKVLSHRIKDLLDKLYRLVETGQMAGDFKALQNALITCMYTNPKITFKVLIKYEHKEFLYKHFDFLFENHHAFLIVSESGLKSATFIMALHEALNELRNDSELVKAINIIDGQLMKIVLKILVSKPTLSGIKLLEVALDHIHNLLSGEQLKQFNTLIEHLFAHDKIVSDTKYEKKFSELKNKLLGTKQGVLSKAHKLILSKQYTKLDIAQFLLQNFSDNDFVLARKSGSLDLKYILEFFFSEGYLLKGPLESMGQQKLSSINSSLKLSLHHNLSELYWVCVLNYSNYQGDKSEFETSFTKAIAFQYDRNINIIKHKRERRAELVKLESGENISIMRLRNIVASGINNTSKSVVNQGKTYTIKECLLLCLEFESSSVVKIFSKTTISDDRINLLSETISIERFCLPLSSELALKSFFEALLSLLHLVEKIAPLQLHRKFYPYFWKEIWNTIQNTRMNPLTYSQLVQKMIFEITEEVGEGAGYCLEEINSKEIPINKKLKEALVKQHNIFELIQVTKGSSTKLSELEKCDRHGLIEELTMCIMLNMHLPSWFPGIHKYKLSELLNEIVIHFSSTFFKVLKHNITSDKQRLKVASQVDIETLIALISKKQPNLSIRLNQLLKLHNSFTRISIGGISSTLLQSILKEKILLAWSNGNWKLINSQNFWNELMWEVCTKRGIKTKLFFSSLHNLVDSFPEKYKLSLQVLIDGNTENQVEILTKLEKVDDMGIELIKEKPAVIKYGIAVRNAGVVLISDYIKILFDRLGLLENDTFSTTDNQLRAIHFLQYVITGQSKTDEDLLPLIKVLCGVHPTTPITSGIEITLQEKELIDGLITAVINYWPTIGDTSIDGFRGNWLVRDGTLTENEETWELTVDKRGYDILINKSPFNLSMIKYPWMDKIMHTHWPY